jgi:nitrate reductase gamma subunit
VNAFTLFGVGPYAAVAVAVVGLGARLLALRFGDPASAGAARAGNKWSIVGGPVGGMAIILLLVGHAILLIAPALVLRWDARPTGLFVVEGSSFFLGIIATVGVAVGVGRHLGASGGSRLGEVGDAVFLSSLSITLAAGLYTAVRYRWASSWGAATVAPYAQSLWQRRPAASLIGEIPFSARLHVTAAFAAVATLPASRLGAALVRGAWRVFVAAGAASESWALGLVGWLRPQRLRLLLWPEEDLADLARLSRRRALAQRLARKARQSGAAPARTADNRDNMETLVIVPGPTDNDVQPPPFSVEGH